jgi:hypothetical protein
LGLEVCVMGELDPEFGLAMSKRWLSLGSPRSLIFAGVADPERVDISPCLRSHLNLTTSPSSYKTLDQFDVAQLKGLP